MNKVIKHIKSMRLGLIMLFYLTCLSFLGSLVPQGRDLAFYTRLYSEKTANLIMYTGLDDVYNSFYFISGVSLLAVNLLLCSIFRFKALTYQMITIPSYKSLDKIKIKDKKLFSDSKDIDNLMKALGFKSYIIKDDKAGVKYFGRKNRLGYLGSWFIHLGVLIIIIFYSYGQFTYYSAAVYGVPATSQTLEGTDIEVVINDFNIDYREDGSVRQYTSNIALLKNNELIKSSDLSVNNPLRYKGYAFYQSSTGWASDIKIYKEEELVSESIFYEGTVIMEEKENIIIQFTKFYPDLQLNASGGVFSVSNELNNPHVLYAIFYNGFRVDINVVPINDVIEWYPYRFVFSNPQRYTYLQVNKMKGKLGAILGSFLIFVGLVICFYFKPKELIIHKEQNKLSAFGKNIPIDI